MMVRIEDVLKNPKWPGAWVECIGLEWIEGRRVGLGRVAACAGKMRQDPHPTPNPYARVPNTYTPTTEEPFFRPGDFSRQDDSNDAVFYDSPRLVTHIDDPAVRSFSGFNWDLGIGCFTDDENCGCMCAEPLHDATAKSITQTNK
jgi:hypothetical protein